MRAPWPVIASAGLVALAGCGHPWPREGRGGMAERDSVVSPGLRQMRDAIAVRAANPGSVGLGPVSQAGELYVRAVREEAGGLRRDADRTMANAALNLAGVDAKTRTQRIGICLTAPCR